MPDLVMYNHVQNSNDFDYILEFNSISNFIFNF